MIDEDSFISVTFRIDDEEVIEVVSGRDDDEEETESEGSQESFEEGVLKQYDRYLGTDLLISNCGQMTKTTSELEPPLQTSVPYQLGDNWPLCMIQRAARPSHDLSS
ncbi:hypothetical protein AVEN_138443-1 [Araneus ventricosus]|uniref:Uncharacterized protein n=1 Tax=Araneus ventricosus TaxID=182803 RepID=A0A4Y2CDK1_ARAVE|nr:hypothetical protein AVEN_138443-1 [Araneus ventricosus]